MLGVWHKNSATPAALEIASLSHVSWCIRHVSDSPRWASGCLRWCILTNSRPVHCIIRAPPAGLPGQLWEVYFVKYVLHACIRHCFQWVDKGVTCTFVCCADQYASQPGTCFRVHAGNSHKVVDRFWSSSISGSALVLRVVAYRPSKACLCKSLWSHKASSHWRAAGVTNISCQYKGND